MSLIFLDKTFNKQNTVDITFKGEYENCSFKGLDLSNKDLSGCIFQSCTFSECNLSLCKLSKTAIRECTFSECKMLGLHFENCNELGLSFSFDNCILNHSCFYKRKLKATSFKNTQLQEVDFSDCDLNTSVFVNCDLKSATFENTILEKVDFRTSYNYSIDPERNKIKKAKFSLSQLAGLLDKYAIEIDTTS